MLLDYRKIIEYYYPEDTPLRRLLLKHSGQVRDKALAIACKASLGRPVDLELVEAGAMLHDIGIGRCNAPSILCTGSSPYLCHGIIGGALLREYGALNKIELEPYARICERHTGAGLTSQEIIAGNLPLPPADYLPESHEEKIVCLADKFFSKSGDGEEKPLAVVRKSLAKFGPAVLARFEQLLQEYY